MLVPPPTAGASEEVATTEKALTESDKDHTATGNIELNQLCLLKFG